MDEYCGRPIACLTIILIAVILEGLVFFISGVSGEPQSFLVEPSNATVIEGGTAILRCQVGAKKGALQWTKDGFALGFDRQIPGFPRYHMGGSEALGEYHLIIERAGLEDDAEYQCQVGPGAGDQALLGRAFLSLIIPPQPPQIEGYTNGSLVKVYSTRSPLSLTCFARDSKPAPTLRWLRNGVDLTPPALEGGTPPPFPAGVVGVEYNSVEAEGKLETGRSVLSLLPTDADNDATYVCEAHNAAMQRPASVVVQLSVLHAPGAPEIQGATTGQVVKTGDTVRLVCVSRGGNPLAQVYWYRNGEELDFSYVSGNGRSENELIFSVRPSDNGVTYRCAASNQLTREPLTTQVKLVVQFAPERVTISGHLNAKAGESVTLKCESAISNPPATISWFTRGRPVSGGTSFSQPSAQGGFVTLSEIKVTLTERENDVIYQCHGTNDIIGQTVVDTVSLKVMFPPERLTISGYMEGASVYAGSVQSLTCTSVGGNPPATVSWWKGAKELEGARRVTGNIVSNQLSFLLKPDDNGAEYRCSASNPATPAPLSAVVKLHVSFPPKSLDVTLTPRVVKVGQSLVISCRSSSSNPASKLSWWKDGDEVRGVDGGTQEAEHGGKSSVSRLELSPSVGDHGAIYACRATNLLLEQAVSDAVTLNVLYKPYFAADAPKALDVREKDSLELNLSAMGNPSDITYTWYRGTHRLSPLLRSKEAPPPATLPKYWQAGGMLNLTAAERSLAGVYIVEASNAEGSSRHDVTVNVLYPAEIASLPPSTLVDASDTATLTCVVNANPLLPAPDPANPHPSLITWSRDGYDWGRATFDPDAPPGTSRLRIEGAVRGDSGAFGCSAYNGVGGRAVGHAELLVRFAPVVDKSPAYGKAAADKGSSAVLQCVAEAAPSVTFAWFKDSVELLGGQDMTHFIEGTQKSGVVSYESRLHVHNTTKADYGAYVCTASNELGSDSIVISLDGTSRPDRPYDLQLYNSTQNSLTLSWRPGFDGGAATHFQLRYSEVGGGGGVTYEDVLPHGVNKYTVGGLKAATQYELTIKAINRLGESEFHLPPLRAKTAETDDIPLIIILTVCVIGLVLLAVNILLILFFIRRRRRKLAQDDDGSSSVSQANTLEMLSTPGLDDYKSYTTYDQHSIDELDEHKLPLDRMDDRYLNAQRLIPYGTEPYGPPLPGPYPPYPNVDEEGYPDKLGQDGGYPGGSLPRRGGGGARVGGAEAVNDEDIYTEQLRRMQRNLALPRGPGSSSQLSSNSYAPLPRASSRPALSGSQSLAPPGATPPSNYGNSTDFPSHQYKPSYPEPGYSTGASLNRLGGGYPTPPTPPELRGHLV